MHQGSTLLAATLAAVLALLAPAAPARAQDVLTGAKAANALVGNTLVFAEEDDVIFLFFAPDRTLKARVGDEPKQATWEIRQDQLCLVDTQANTEECAAYEVAGARVTIIDVSDPSITKKGTLLRGNPLEM